MICVKYNYMDFDKLGRKMIKNSLLSLKVLEAQEIDSERRNFNFTGEASIPVVNMCMCLHAEEVDLSYYNVRKL